MRIVITNKGTKIIEDLSPDNSIDYNSDSNIFNSRLLEKKRKMKIKKNISLNILKTHTLQKNKRFHSQKSLNIYSNENNIDIDDLLNNFVNKQNIKRNNNIANNIKMINLNNNKKVKLPKLLENKYLIYDAYKSDKQKKYLPNILLSINDSIDNDLLNQKDMKKMRSFSEFTINDSNNNINDDLMLPRIRKNFPLKYIIGKDSVKRLKKEMTNYEKSCDKEKKLFPLNYFINKNWEKKKKILEKSLNNEINSKNINLIEYLNKNKKITNIFIQKFSDLNNEKMDKLENISKKLLYKKEQDKQIHENIKNKIKTNLMNINIDFRKSLNNMNSKLNEYDSIINKNKERIIPNDKNRYLEHYIEAQKNWDKFNLYRFYKKSALPKTNDFRSLLY